MGGSNLSIHWDNIVDQCSDSWIADLEEATNFPSRSLIDPIVTMSKHLFGLDSPLQDNHPDDDDIGKNTISSDAPPWWWNSRLLGLWEFMSTYSKSCTGLSRFIKRSSCHSRMLRPLSICNGVCILLNTYGLFLVQHLVDHSRPTDCCLRPMIVYFPSFLFFPLYFSNFSMSLRLDGVICTEDDDAGIGKSFFCPSSWMSREVQVSFLQMIRLIANNFRICLPIVI